MLSHPLVRRIATFLFPLVLLLATLAATVAAPTAPAAAVVLSDSTTTDSWRLANGLEVRVRNVPGAAGVAIVVAYRAGTGYETVGREGFAPLLAELEYTATAGDTPERTREEMSSIRPLGWGLKINERLTVLSEIASPEQFPGMLRQVATRMRGVTPTAADLQAAIAMVRNDLGNRQFGRADLGLYYRVRDLALGTSDEQVLRRASGDGIKSVTLKEALTGLRRLYVPANASIAIAGDLRDLDIHALVAQEFGGIPGGTAQAELPMPVLKPALRAAPFSGLDHSAGALGVFAPSLDDSLHPAFFLSMVITGPWFTDKFGRPAPPLTSRFQYSLFDEPDLVRFYPEPLPTDTDPAVLNTQFSPLVDVLAEATLERKDYDAVRRSVSWLLGGTLASGAKKQFREQPGALGTMATSMASRAIWRGDGFWDLYRQRFETTSRGHNTFAHWIADPEHQAGLLFTAKP